MKVRPEERLQSEFTTELIAGLKLGHQVRSAALAVIAAWLLIENPWPESAYYLLLLIAFWLLGYLPYGLASRGRDSAGMLYLFPFLDMALLTFTLLSNNPFDPTPIPYPLKYRFDNELYFMIIVMVAAFTYTPKIVLWSGVSAAVCWTAGAVWVALQPDVLAAFSSSSANPASEDAAIAVFLNPNALFFVSILKFVMIVLLVSGGLAVAVNRARRLVYRHAASERARANLSRHFSPNMVDALAERDASLSETKSQQVAVLFADIVGFTGISEGRAPDDVITLLREFHGRVAGAVFEHDGTLDKYLGDGVMATFGTPDSRGDDVIRALDCARAIVRSVSHWNAEREARGDTPIRVGVGLHFGPVVLGDIGDEHRLEYAVIGDTVNVASRVEELTRALDADIVVSGAVIAAAREGGADATVLDEFETAAPQSIRGREEPVPVWVWRAN